MMIFRVHKNEDILNKKSIVVESLNKIQETNLHTRCCIQYLIFIYECNARAN